MEERRGERRGEGRGEKRGEERREETRLDETETPAQNRPGHQDKPSAVRCRVSPRAPPSEW